MKPSATRHRQNITDRRLQDRNIYIKKKSTRNVLPVADSLMAKISDLSMVNFSSDVAGGMLLVCYLPMWCYRIQK